LRRLLRLIDKVVPGHGAVSEVEAPFDRIVSVGMFEQPTHIVGTAALFVDTAHRPLAAVDSEILAVALQLPAETRVAVGAKKREPGPMIA
jgi:hypothetical protein